MKIILITGVLLLFNGLCVYSEDQVLSISSQNLKNSLKLICSLFSKLNIGRCPESFTPVTYDSRMSTEPDIKIKLNKDEVIPMSDLIAPQDIRCDKCREYIARFEILVKKSMKPTDFQKRIIDVCKIYNNPLKDQCISFYHGVGFEIIKAILQSKDPKEVCKIIKVCSEMDKNMDHLEILDKLIDAIEPNKRNACKRCIQIIEWYEKNINNSKSAVSIQKPLLRSCDIYKERVSVYCKFYLYTTGFKALQEILKKKCPLKICQHLHYCRRRDSGVDSSNEKTGLSLPTNLNKQSEGCKICIGVVNIYEIIIDKSISPSDVQKSITMICQVFKNPFKDQCTSFYKGIGFELIKAILAGENPLKACQLIGNCKKNEGLILYQKFLDLLVNGFKKNASPCFLCTTYVKFFESSLDSSKSEGEIFQALSQECNIYITPVKQMCHQYYNGIGKIVLKAILNKEDPRKVCITLTYCQNGAPSVTDSNLNVQLKDLIKPEKDQCDVCKHIVARLEKVIKKSIKPADFQKRAIDVCGIFKNPLKDQCVSFYKGVGFEVIKALLKSKSPEEICRIIKYCVKMNENQDHLKFLDKLIDAIEPNKRNACKRCVQIIEWYEKNINNSKSAVSIQKPLLRYCGIYKERLSVYCKFFFYTTGFKTIQEIVKKKCPLKICQHLHYCRRRDSEIVSSDDKTDNEQLNIPKTLKSNRVNLIKSNDLMAQEITKLCTLLSTPMRESCVEFIKIHGIKFIVEKENLIEIYNNLLTLSGLKNENIGSNEISKDSDGNPIECFLCKEIMKELEKFLVKKRSKEEIKKALSKVCNIVHGKMKKKCKKFVNKYSDKIVDLLIKNVAAKKVCSYLLVCSSKDDTLYYLPTTQLN